MYHQSTSNRSRNPHTSLTLAVMAVALIALPA